MRRIFIQFYLLLIACFLVAVLGVGLVYKRAGSDMGDRYLADLLQATLTMIEDKLKDVPPPQWGQTLARLDPGLTFKVRVEPVGAYELDEPARAALARGDIVMLEDSSEFLQRLPGNDDYMLVAGPLDYLLFLHQLKWIDYLLLALVGLSLAVPVLLWMRPHWRDLMALEAGARALAHGELSRRVALSERSGVFRVAEAFNQMADAMEETIASKQGLIRAVAHELRTPLARLRYRLAMLGGDAAAQRAIERDIDAIDSLVEELLLHVRLDRPETPLTVEVFDGASWLAERVDEAAALWPGLVWSAEPGAGVGALEGDRVLLSRALDNLLGNARRYARSMVRARLERTGGRLTLTVDDDGPGIPEGDRERVLDPFVRLDASRARDTGGHGLGLAIVASVMRAHHGEVRVETSPEGGARLVLAWPALHSVTEGNTADAERRASAG
ncbi:two-component system sensor histidine kinase RstB [Crenobacter luteus]|uniref:two-component system sensor histidine kinase RstB n=1 Tax=Crenobacter luteus TaxID=1452487 RepID=UPI0010510A56|nr:two-component system sensor histidine kinase RstB [Crenobacter luteus]TCP08418.1 two-component system sensor histidine kinase RstB [Crenobacter luteus]